MRKTYPVGSTRRIYRKVNGKRRLVHVTKLPGGKEKVAVVSMKTTRIATPKKPKYTIIEDSGKPAEYSANTIAELETIMEEIGNRAMSGDNQTDVMVIDNKTNRDITESQLIVEMTEEIIEKYYKVKP